MSGQARRKHMRVLKYESGVPLDRTTKSFLNDHPSYAATMARMVKRSNARKRPYAPSDATPSPGTDNERDLTPRASPRSTTAVGYAPQSRSVASDGLSNSSASYSAQRISAASPMGHLNIALPSASGHRVSAAASTTVPSISAINLPGTLAGEEALVGEAPATTPQPSPVSIKQETPADAFFMRLLLPAVVSQENISNETADAPLSAPALVDRTPDYIKQPIPIRAAVPDWVQGDLLSLHNQNTEEDDDLWMQSEYYDRETLEQVRSVIALSRSMPSPPPFEDLPEFIDPPLCSCMNSDCEQWTFPGNWGHRFEPFVAAMSRTPSPFPFTHAFSATPFPQEFAPFSGQQHDQDHPVQLEPEACVIGKRGRDDSEREDEDEGREGSSKKAKTSV